MIPRSEVTGSATERVTLGWPAAEIVREEAEQRGSRRVFILAGETLRRDTEAVAAIERALGPRHALTHSGMRAHAPASDVVAATRAAREAGADLIVGVGGGSAMDSAKILGLALRHAVDSVAALGALRIRYDAAGTITARPDAGPEVRAILVPTTLSGAEFNSLAGAYDEDLGQKQGYQHPLMAPAVVVLDPAITRHTPEWLWLSTGIRAVDHAVETLVSPHSNPYHDGLAESGLRLLAGALPRVRATPDDLAARLDCQIGAWQAILPLVAGVPMGASHAIGHALGAACGTPHGYTSCVMAAHVQRWNAVEAMPSHARIADALGSPGAPVADLLATLIAGLGLPTRLPEIGVTPAAHARLAELTLADLWGGTNVRPLTEAGVLEILAAAQR